MGSIIFFKLLFFFFMHLANLFLMPFESRLKLSEINHNDFFVLIKPVHSKGSRFVQFGFSLLLTRTLCRPAKPSPYNLLDLIVLTDENN